MNKARAARKLATAALSGVGGVGVLGGALFVLLGAEAMLARRAIGGPVGEAPQANGIYGYGDGEEISFVVLGDSTACGFGVQEPDETPGAMLAGGLASLSGRPVRLTGLGVVGAETQHLDVQVDQALEQRPDLALIIVGANDVTHRIKPSESVRLLAEAIHRLRAAGSEVVVGTCPDLGTIEPVAPPLRQIARYWSRSLARAQTAGAVAAGARTVSLGSLLGPAFAAAPRELFGPDRFHPSATGYASACVALLPSLAAALGYWSDDEDGDAHPDGEVLPISFAAARAAKDEGTEVTPRGRWAILRQREPEAELPLDGADIGSQHR